MIILSNSYVNEQGKLNLKQTKPISVESLRGFGKVISNFADLIEVIEKQRKIPEFPDMESLDTMTEEQRKKEENERNT